jgi:hypothetical protein
MQAQFLLCSKQDRLGDSLGRQVIKEYLCIRNYLSGAISLSITLTVLRDMQGYTKREKRNKTSTPFQEAVKKYYLAASSSGTFSTPTTSTSAAFVTPSSTPLLEEPTPPALPPALRRLASPTFLNLSASFGVRFNYLIVSQTDPWTRIEGALRRSRPQAHGY